MVEHRCYKCRKLLNKLRKSFVLVLHRHEPEDIETVCTKCKSKNRIRFE